MFAVPPTSTDLLELEARGAWASDALGRPWTLYGSLSFATAVSGITVEKHLVDWATQFRRDITGSAIMLAWHLDTDRPHAHVLIFIPRRVADPFHPSGVSVVGWVWPQWLALWWRHGRVWAEPFDPDRFQSSTRGAAAYLARDPGTVMTFGEAPRRTDNT